MRNILVGVMEKSTDIGIQLWALDVSILLLGSGPSKLGPFEMKCGTQMPCGPSKSHGPACNTSNSEGANQK